MGERSGNGRHHRREDAGSFAVRGRVVSRRRSGGITFAHVRTSGVKLQVIAQKEYCDARFPMNVGDIVEVVGFPGIKRGETSLICTDISLLAPCLQHIPSGRGDGKYGLQDRAVLQRQRHVDMLVNAEECARVFGTRSMVLRGISRFLACAQLSGSRDASAEHRSGGRRSYALYDAVGCRRQAATSFAHCARAILEAARCWWDGESVRDRKGVPQ